MDKKVVGCVASLKIRVGLTSTAERGCHYREEFLPVAWVTWQSWRAVRLNYRRLHTGRRRRSIRQQQWQRCARREEQVRIKAICAYFEDFYSRCSVSFWWMITNEYNYVIFGTWQLIHCVCTWAGHASIAIVSWRKHAQARCILNMPKLGNIILS